MSLSKTTASGPERSAGLRQQHMYERPPVAAQRTIDGMNTTPLSRMVKLITDIDRQSAAETETGELVMDHAPANIDIVGLPGMSQSPFDFKIPIAPREGHVSVYTYCDMR